jgi:DNA-directed RNA polymerase subunit M/transcription elongation factor TFIIS
MMIYYGVKKYKEKRNAKKANEASDGSKEPSSNDQSKPVCPQCQETSKIDFQRRDEGGTDATWATCRKCGSQWRHK